MAVVINHEFRDMSAQASYPLDVASTLVQGEVAIDPGMLLDALVYPVVPAAAPYRIGWLDGNGEGNALAIGLVDSDGAAVGSAICASITDTAMLKDAGGRVIGVLVYDSGLLAELLGKVGRRRLELDPTAARFTAGVCHSPRLPGMLYLAPGGTRMHGDVVLAAIGGVQFTPEAVPPPIESSSRSSASGSEASSSSTEALPSSASSHSSKSGTSSLSSSSETLTSGRIAVNVHGEMYTQRQPVVTVNDLEMRHLWLAAHQDESAIRVRTNAGEYIEIGKAKDFGYAT